ncbi:MAG: hypothetical protein WBH86_16840, partial [Thermogutta sp.]
AAKFPLKKSLYGKWYLKRFWIVYTIGKCHAQTTAAIPADWVIGTDHTNGMATTKGWEDETDKRLCAKETVADHSQRFDAD